MPQKREDFHPIPRYNDQVIKTPNPKPINDIPSSKCGDVIVAVLVPYCLCL